MRYIDSGSRDPAQALGTWLNAELTANVAELRIQTGFFSGDALAPFGTTFAALSAAGGLANVVIGSNDGGTLRPHLDELVAAMGVPRANARLGVVYYASAYYHPKTIHLRRSDGSQAAYVGSANVTLPGIGAKHVEAGVLFDTLQGDPSVLLDSIAAATDAWFGEDRAGLEIVTGPQDVQRLLDEGVIRTVAPPRPPRPAAQGGQPPQRPSLAPLVTFVKAAAPAPQAQPPVEAAAALAPGPVAWTPLPSEQRTPPYPPHIFFAPGATEPTRGTDALTGLTLGDATGLIIKLSRDNDRHWRLAPGTANITIPVSTTTTLRFGVYGERDRPRAEFDLAIRYVDDASTVLAPVARTGIMSFGFTPGDTGHQDLRLVLPRPPIAELRDKLIAQGAHLPEAGDLAILEWPTPEAPSFRMTVTDPTSELGGTIRGIWQQASVDGQLASRGASWLPAGVAPLW